MSSHMSCEEQANHLIETFERADSNVIHGFHIPNIDRLTIGIVTKRGTLDKVKALIDATIEVTNKLTGIEAPFDIQYFEECDES